MPTHTIPRAHLEVELIRITRSGEHVLHLVPDGDMITVITDAGVTTREAVS